MRTGEELGSTSSGAQVLLPALLKLGGAWGGGGGSGGEIEPGLPAWKTRALAPNILF